MLPAYLKLPIARLDPGSLTAFAGGLLSAEAARLGMPYSALTVSDDITDADEGLDALMEGVPDDAANDLPAGEVGFQFKAIRRRGKGPAVLGIPDELGKPGPTRVLRNGGAYVLVWSQDLNPAQKKRVLDTLVEEAGKIVDDPRVAVWDAQTLANLGLAHPAVTQSANIADFGAALSLPEVLESLHADDRPWVPDAARQQAVQKLRDRAAEHSSDSVLASVRGDPGVGKTRLAAEALAEEPWINQTLYLRTSEGAPRLLATLRRNPDSEGILILDEFSQAELQMATETISATRGRWRLLKVSSRESTRYAADGPRDVVLRPLEAEAMRELIQEHSGLDEHAAVRVAEIAQGFPELAFVLADELAADPSLDLATLARSSEPEARLDRFLDEERRRALAPLALFAAVGFDGDVRYELEAIADAFEVPIDELERVASLELGRFVSEAGRYRQVSPLLVAVWLAISVFEGMTRLEDRLNGLPESLQQAFAQQLEYFGPTTQNLPAAISRILNDDRYRRPEAFDEAAGHFLRATAAIVPEVVATIILDLIEAASEDQLVNLPRRNLVWALQVLLWWPETWQTAIEAMFRLAQYESETWANNASGQFAQFFSVLLAGTTVPFSERITWLEERIEQAQMADLDLLSQAAAAGLKSHHSRASTGFRGGGEPQDWRPDTYEDLWAAHRSSWHALLSCRDRALDPARRLEMTKLAAQGVRLLFRSGLWTEVDQDLRSRTDWTPAERSQLMVSLRDVLQFESELPEDGKNIASDLARHLEGEDLATRVAVILQTGYWDLRDRSERSAETPAVLHEIADELAAAGSTELIIGGPRGEHEDEQTRFALMRLLASRLGPEELASQAMNATPPDWGAVAAAVSVADQQGLGDWATAMLRETAASGNAGQAAMLLNHMDVTDERLDLVLDLVDSGDTSGSDLARMLYGARATAIDVHRLQRLVRALSSAGRSEHALGILDQWLESNDTRSEELSETIYEVGAIALRDGGGGSMTEHYLAELAEARLLDAEQILDWWRLRLAHRDSLPAALDATLTSVALEADPEGAADLVLELVAEQAKGSPTAYLLVSDEGLLSQAASVVGADAIWSALRGQEEHTLRVALHQMDWSGHEPDPLVRAFLESDRLEALADEASICFFNTLGVVMGPYHKALERELDRAVSWGESLDGPAERWASQLRRRYEHDIEQSRRREAEHEVRFR